MVGFTSDGGMRGGAAQAREMIGIQGPQAHQARKASTAQRPGTTEGRTTRFSLAVQGDPEVKASAKRGLTR
jgi:hypothetical protein